MPIKLEQNKTFPEGNLDADRDPEKSRWNIFCSLTWNNARVILP